MFSQIYTLKTLILNSFCSLCRMVMSLSECNSGTIQKSQFGVDTRIELKNITTASDNTGTLVCWNTPRLMPFLSDVVVTFMSSIVVLTPSGQFVDCVTNALSERCDCAIFLDEIVSLLRHPSCCWCKFLPQQLFTNDVLLCACASRQLFLFVPGCNVAHKAGCLPYKPGNHLGRLNHKPGVLTGCDVTHKPSSFWTIKYR